MNPMQSFRAISLVLLLPLLAACGSDSAPDEAGDATVTGSTESIPGSDQSASFVDDFAEACLRSSNWDRGMCECAGRKAQDELSDVARDFVLATLQENIPEIERLRPSLSIEEATQTAMFMVHAGSACAQ